MKYPVLIFVLFFYLFSYQSTIYAAGPASPGGNSVYDAIQKGGGKAASSAANVAGSQSPSLFPLFLQFIFSFAVVVVLLILLLRFLSRRNRFSQPNGPILPLGGQALGTNRSLQIVLIGQTIYILGVGETVTLIRTISQGEEYQHLLESYENQADGFSPKWLPKDPKQMWDSIFRKHLDHMKKENGEEEDL